MIESHNGREFEDLAPEPIVEPWSECSLADGSLIRMRTTLAKVKWPRDVEHMEHGQPDQLPLEFNTQVVVFPPASLKGERNPTPPSVNDAKKMPLEEVEIEKQNEPWSKYKLPKGKGGLKTRVIVSGVYRVRNLYNAEGDPYYIVNSTFVVAPYDVQRLAGCRTEPTT